MTSLVASHGVSLYAWLKFNCSISIPVLKPFALPRWQVKPHAKLSYPHSLWYVMGGLGWTPKGWPFNQTQKLVSWPLPLAPWKAMFLSVSKLTAKPHLNCHWLEIHSCPWRHISDFKQIRLCTCHPNFGLHPNWSYWCINWWLTITILTPWTLFYQSHVVKIIMCFQYFILGFKSQVYISIFEILYYFSFPFSFMSNGHQEEDTMSPSYSLSTYAIICWISLHKNIKMDNTF